MPKQSKITSFFAKTPPSKPRSLRLSAVGQPSPASNPSTSGQQSIHADNLEPTAEPLNKIAHTGDKLDVHGDQDDDAIHADSSFVTAEEAELPHKVAYTDETSDVRPEILPEGATVNEPPVAKVLTAEQHQRIHQNYMRALLIRTSRTNSVVQETIGSSWFEALREEFQKPYFLKLSEFVTRERETKVVYPPAANVFAWTENFPIQETKVVILGQDPYHGPSMAMGLCFSVPVLVPLPRSLINIYQELSTEYPGIILPKHGNLTGWAKQGVLLLNTCLTVRAGDANSHAGRGWEEFTDAVIMWLNEHLTGVVFLLWGRSAQIKGVKINSKRHHVLKAAHPSPLSALKFFGCGHFTQTNELLIKQEKHIINWSEL